MKFNLGWFIVAVICLFLVYIATLSFMEKRKLKNDHRIADRFRKEKRQAALKSVCK